jgi:acyl dehydratase
VGQGSIEIPGAAGDVDSVRQRGYLLSIMQSKPPSATDAQAGASFVDGLRDLVGHEFFRSEPFEVRQVDVDVFAAVTRDWDYMHNDPEWSANVGPFGTTIAHGYFLLSLVPYFHGKAGWTTVANDHEFVLNYGVDRVRFIEPMLVGDEFRLSFHLTSIEQRKPGQELIRHQARYYTERLGGDRPHVIADCLTLAVQGDARAAVADR